MNESLPPNRPQTRSDRLIGIISIMRDGELHRAADMAQHFDVSERTLYRDMDTLALSGVPIKGERGAGYQMTAPVTLPPLNLSMAELEALHLGLAVMTEASDPDLRDSAKSLANKIDAALPEEGPSTTKSWGLAVFPFADTAAGVRHIPAIRRAIRGRKKLSLHCQDEHNQDKSNATTERVVHPLKLEYWGRVWTTTVWSEQEKAPLLLRVDGIKKLTELPETFE